MENQSKQHQTATTVRGPTNFEVPAWHPTLVWCPAQKPPDMQIRLDSFYCPAECQLFPILGWLGSPFQGSQMQDSVIWVKDNHRQKPTQRWAHCQPPCQDHEHQLHSHHFGPRGNHRHVSGQKFSSAFLFTFSCQPRMRPTIVVPCVWWSLVSLGKGRHCFILTICYRDPSIGFS